MKRPNANRWPSKPADRTPTPILNPDPRTQNLSRMPNPRILDKRRRSIRNIRKITRTMELIATARFKKAMDRASAATAYTNRITQLVRDLDGQRTGG